MRGIKPCFRRKNGYYISIVYGFSEKIRIVYSILWYVPIFLSSESLLCFLYSLHPSWVGRKHGIGRRMLWHIIDFDILNSSKRGFATFYFPNKSHLRIILYPVSKVMQAISISNATFAITDIFQLTTEILKVILPTYWAQSQCKNILNESSTIKLARIYNEPFFFCFVQSAPDVRSSDKLFCKEKNAIIWRF